jgi:predicted O-methyltransferase YrrM
VDVCSNGNIPAACTLHDTRVSAVLHRLHADAKKESTRGVVLKLLWNRLRGYKNSSWEEAVLLKDLFLPLSPEAGRFVYLLARAISAQRIVEFGTSFGISTIYLAAAVRDNGGGVVIGSELEPGKVRRARAYLEEAGLAELVEVREGDALETLRDPGGPVDLLFLDGWKTQYLQVLEMVRPFLHAQSMVLADDATRFRARMAEFVNHLGDPQNGFCSVTVPIGEGIEFSLFTRQIDRPAFTPGKTAEETQEQNNDRGSSSFSRAQNRLASRPQELGAV